MSKIILTAILFSCLLMPCVIHAQWSLSQLPTTQPLSDVYFADSLNGWVSSFVGIFHTTDAGQNWILQDTSVVYDLAGIDKNECWAMSAYVDLLHTTNGGTHWSKTSILTMIDSVDQLGRIQFIDNLHGWIPAMRYGYTENWVLKTTDGGVWWTPHFVYSNSNFSYICSFVDTVSGWLDGGNHFMLQTVNGGMTWDSVGYASYRSLMDMKFLTKQVGWVTADGPAIITAVRKTTDGGKNWNVQKIFDCSDRTTYISFPDTVNGWVVQYTCLGNQLEIWHTKDGGTNWELQWVQPGVHPHRIFFSDINNGWVVTRTGKILHTTNGGITAVEDDRIPSTFRLSQNYPNPFNPSTTIEYELPITSTVSLKIFNLLGQEVRTLVEGVQDAGYKSVTFDASSLPSGLYFYRLQAGTFNDLKKMLLVR